MHLLPPRMRRSLYPLVTILTVTKKVASISDFLGSAIPAIDQVGMIVRFVTDDTAAPNQKGASFARRKVAIRRPLGLIPYRLRERTWSAACRLSVSELRLTPAWCRPRVAALAAALSHVPDDQRRAIELHHFHGLTVPEVAGRMEKTVAAVTRLLYRGSEVLRQHLREF